MGIHQNRLGESTIIRFHMDIIFMRSFLMWLVGDDWFPWLLYDFPETLGNVIILGFTHGESSRINPNSKRLAGDIRPGNDCYIANLIKWPRKKVRWFTECKNLVDLPCSSFFLGQGLPEGNWAIQRVLGQDLTVSLCFEDRMAIRKKLGVPIRSYRKSPFLIGKPSISMGHFP